MNPRSVLAGLAVALLSSAAMSVSVVSWPSPGFAQDSEPGVVEEQAPRKEKKKRQQVEEGQVEQQMDQAPAVVEEQAPRKEKKRKQQQAVEPEQQDQAPAVAEEQAPRKEKKRKQQQAVEPEQQDQAPAVAEEQAPRKEKKRKQQQAIEPEQQDQAPAVVEEQAPRKEKKKQQAVEPEQQDQAPAVVEEQAPRKEKKKQQAVEPEQQDQAPAVVEEQAPRKEKKKQQALEPEQTPSVEQAETPTKPDRKKTGTEDQQDSSQAAEQGSDDAQSKAAVTAIKDRRNASELEDDELRARFQNVRRAAKSPGLSADQRREFENMAASDRRELLRRKGGGKKQQAAEQERPEDLSKAEVDQRADDLLRQKREAKELDDQALRQRLDETRTVLGSEELSREEQDRLRKRLREDRRVMRERMARRSGEPVDIYVDRRDYSRDDLDRALRDRRRGNDVRERDLNERIRMMRYALNNERYDREQAEMANEYLREDRRVLRERLRRDRDRRRERLSAMRDRDELEIEYDPGYLPPPVIAYAEADDEDIEMQLVAPPRQKLQRRYTVEQIVQDDRVREAMPGIDIDTLTFDTGSAEVRPEEIAKLDKVAETIERIVTARPDEVFMIEGHTDAIGSDASNQILSEARARSIMEALTEFYAIEPDNLRTVGLGERFLKIPTPEAEQENRRVTVRRITPLLARDGG